MRADGNLSHASLEPRKKFSQYNRDLHISLFCKVFYC